MSADAQQWVGVSMDAPQRVTAGDATVIAYTHGYAPEANQDALGLCDLGPAGLLLALSDGAGGLPGGASAAALAIQHVLDAARAALASEQPIQAAVLQAFDTANDAITALGIGAAATLAVVTLEGRALRTYHAGDSGVLVTGQRGRLRLVTIPHSPTGYAVEAGVMSERQALRHAERHVVSNVLGSVDMRIEIGPRLDLAAYDTVVLASDGLLDNLRSDQIAEHVRRGPLLQATQALLDAARARMEAVPPAPFGKPDDLSALLLRPRRC